MAIGAVARGDLVVVHSTKLNAHGLFVVDSVNGNAVTVMPLDHAQVQVGHVKSPAMTVDKTTEIFAVHTAASISV
jgi:hypothetical protein